MSVVSIRTVSLIPFRSQLRSVCALTDNHLHFLCLRALPEELQKVLRVQFRMLRLCC